MRDGGIGWEGVGKEEGRVGWKSWRTCIRELRYFDESKEQSAS